MPDELLAAVERNTEATEATRIEAEMLRHEVRQNRTRTAMLVVAFVAFALLSAAAWLRFSTVLERLEEVAGQNRDNGDRLIECTEPSPGPGKGRDRADDRHECFERGQASTAQAVGTIVDGNRNGRPDSLEVLDALAGLSRPSSSPATPTPASPSHAG